MIYGLIDGSSLFEIASLLGGSSIDSIYPLAWQCSIDITTTLINGHNLGLLGTPGFERTPGPSGLLLREVGGFVPRLHIEGSDRERIRTEVINWALTPGGQLQVQNAMAAVKDTDSRLPLQPGSNFEPWLRHIVESYWVQQNRFLGGVFEERYVEPIAAVLQMPVNEVDEIRKLGLDERALASFAKDFPIDNQDFRLLVDCYLVTNFLRGRNHDDTCRERSWHYIPHPLRLPALDGAGTSGQHTYSASNTADYLSKIILAAALTERAVERRIVQWSSNVEAARKAVASGELDLQYRDSPEVSLKVAVKGARQLGIKTHARHIDKVIDAALAVGISAVTSFTLLNWQDLVSGILLYGLSEKINLGERIAGTLLDRDRRFEDLATSEPGRLQQVTPS